MSSEAANNARDARLRKRMLDTLHRARIGPFAGLSARTLVDVVKSATPMGQGFEDDDHAAGLLMDLANAGYCTVKDTRTHRHQSRQIDFLFAKVTSLGSKLSLEEAPVDALVDDGRRDGTEED